MCERERERVRASESACASFSVKFQFWRKMLQSVSGLIWTIFLLASSECRRRRRHQQLLQQQLASSCWCRYLLDRFDYCVFKLVLPTFEPISRQWIVVAFKCYCTPSFCFDSVQFRFVLYDTSSDPHVNVARHIKVFFAKQFIHFIKRDTKNTENKSLHTFNKC